MGIHSQQIERIKQIILIAICAMMGDSAVLAVEIPTYSEAYLDSMALVIEPGDERPYVYSGEGSAFFYGTTGDQASGHMGFWVGEYKLWDDFEIMIDGVQLNRSEAKATFTPYDLTFEWESGIILEILPLFRERNYLGFKFRGAKDGSKAAFRLKYTTMLENVSADRFPRVKQALTNGIDIYSVVGTPKTGFTSLQGGNAIESVFDRGGFNLAFIYAESLEKLHKEYYSIEKLIPDGMYDRQQWCLEEINRSYFRCNDDRINQALNWMKISLASLWAEDGSALWAGFPWFNDCWGRDTFISVPGACLVQGDFEGAKKLFQRFAEWQDKDPESETFGRIPNRVRAGEIIYNTADGTPWFIRELYEYGLYSGDWDFIRDNFEVVVRAADGAMKFHTDSLGFMVHGDAETWMDAVGTDGPWSPRGNRAVEIQALWLAQLEASVRMAEKIGWNDEEKITVWENYIVKLRDNFRKYYIREDGKGLYDHLNADGTPDLKIRPNQLFAYTVPLEHIPLPPNDPQKLLARVETFYALQTSTIYKYGVASLSQFDEDFHPFHQHPMYPKDEAYHMGIIWTWLSGPYKDVSLLTGWAIAESEIDLTLNRGAPGTMCEVLDAIPREGNDFPELSGTVSQAWSLAEFIRTFYQDYLRINPEFSLNSENLLTITPKIPREIGSFKTVLNTFGCRILFNLTINDSTAKINLSRLDHEEHDLTIRLFNNDDYEFNLSNSDTSFIFNRHFSKNNRDSSQIWLADDEHGNHRFYNLFLENYPEPKFAEPLITPDLKCLQPPTHRILSGAEVKASNPESKTICDLDDPPGDDLGDGDYVYPTDPNFKPGILDLTHFTMQHDNENVYFKLHFKDLAQPGWHPEYGFQLTFATIAINTGEGDTRQNVGRNSGWTLEKGWETDRFVHVGGGLVVENGTGKILAEHIPWEEGYELGDAGNKMITFAIPQDLLPGNPEEWKIMVLIGAQDDHGGAGIGEFRAVKVEVGRWHGGGNNDGNNVYDWLKVTP